MDYELELGKIAEEVKKIASTTNGKPVKVCLQFPDGLKTRATEVVAELEKTSGVPTEFVIWSGSNFGGCDYPWYLKDLGFDLLVNFGHAVFKKWPDKV